MTNYLSNNGNSKEALSGEQINGLLSQVINNASALKGEHIKIMRDFSIMMTMNYMSDYIGKANENNTELTDRIEKQEKSIEFLALRLSDKEEVVETLKKKVESLKDEIHIDPRERDIIQRKLKARAYEILKDKKYFNFFKKSDNDTIEDLIGKVNARNWNNTKKHFGASSYHDFKRSDFDDAIQLISNFEPKIYY